ncbi:MAG: class I SAM-dependent methyltransferase [Candidatus Pacebacteria bacterium]|nr:class I SAM-dependent methyltransferase [Candidatus Paceibacterota bacterium]
MIKKRQKDVWNKVYSKYTPAELPWFNLKFPKEVTKWISALDKNTTMIIPGCGFGDTAGVLSKMGFRKIMGTDISKKATAGARKRFPKLKFKTVETEKLNQERYANANIFDWLNFHHINRKNIRAYLFSLQKICNTLILAYIFEPELGKKRNSYITGEKVYNHNPADVIKILDKLTQKKKLTFEFKINPKFGNKKHKAVAFMFIK